MVILVVFTLINYFLFISQAKIAFGNPALSVFVTGLIFTVMLLIFLEKTVFSRLEDFTAQVCKIEENRNHNRQLKVSPQARDDELANLAREINLLLDELEAARSKMLESEARLRLITDNMRDIICIIDSSFRIQFISPSVKGFLDYEPEELFCRNILDFIYEPDRPKLQQLYREITAEQPEIREEIRLRHRNSSFIWVEVNGKLLFDERDQVKHVVIVVRNIEERKEAMEQLIYLTMHDPVTGLYNRRYFEAELQRFYKEEDYPISVIAADMDGLSLVNDTMGHTWGDRLLKRCANILRKRVGPKGKTFRIGGDEFALVLLRTGDAEASELIDRIHDEIIRYNRGNPGLPLKVSLGYAVNGGCSASIKKTFEQADDRMYRNKLYRTIKNREQNTQTLLEILAERDQLEDGHAERMEDLCLKLAQQIGLSGQQVKDLSLLALVHDLGKIGIPKKILFKDGPLTAEEWEFMRRHPEKGYRIASSFPDLTPIADLILLHHERWDGSGYPLGLEGEEIPLECRILAIADAYDNMTNARYYGTVRSKEEALAELQRCAGTQFDPVLVEIFIKLVAE
jgi:diguanylate cyclase (GGDEF)-like protein/PAS domain S-box-containing protein